jgi:hypothetical protein
MVTFDAERVQDHSRIRANKLYEGDALHLGSGWLALEGIVALIILYIIFVTDYKEEGQACSAAACRRIYT